MKHEKFGNSTTFRLCPDCGNSYPITSKRCPRCGYEEAFEGKRAGLHYPTGKTQTNNLMSCKSRITQYIPGFRHHIKWRMVLSVLYYIAAIFSVFSVSTYPVYAKLIQLFLYFGVAYFIALIYKPPFGMKRWLYAVIGVIMLCIGFAGNNLIHYLPGGLVRGYWVSKKPYAFTVDVMTKNLDNYVPGLYTFKVTGTPGKRPMYDIYISQEPKKSITQDDIPVFTVGGQNVIMECNYTLNSGDYVYVVPYPVIYKASGRLYINRVD